MNFYVHQLHDYAIGNFINCTPVLQTLSAYYGEKIPVLFDTKVVNDMMLNASFIKPITSKPNRICLFNSSLRNMEMPDWQYIHKTICNKLNIPSPKVIPHTYVDKVDTIKTPIDKPFVCIANGCAGAYWKEKKDPGEDIYLHICKKIYESGRSIVFIGSDKEKHKLESMRNKLGYGTIVLNDIRESLGLLHKCDFLVANDTGMYHAASALNTRTFVLWKDTPFIKNKSPSINITYSQKDSWKKDFEMYEY